MLSLGVGKFQWKIGTSYLDLMILTTNTIHNQLNVSAYTFKTRIAVDGWMDGWGFTSFSTVKIISRRVYLDRFGAATQGTGVVDKGSFPLRHSILTWSQPVLALFL